MGENFGETSSPVEISISGQKCLQGTHYGWSQTTTLDHPWSNSGRPYLSCIPQETRVGEKTLKIKVAHKTIHLSAPSSQATGPLYARCFKNFYGLYGEHCISCWKFNRQTKYSKSVEAGELTVFAAECTGEFAPKVGMSEPLAKAGFAILPPSECKYKYDYVVIQKFFLTTDIFYHCFRHYWRVSI